MGNTRRKFATVLALEVAEHERLAAASDSGLAASVESRLETARHLIGHSEGHFVDRGNGRVVAEFPNVADAVRCAVAIQKALLTTNSSLPLEQRVLLRIGLSVGDVSEESGGLQGEAVEIAVGLTALAVPGGICLTRYVYEHAQHNVHVRFEFAGEKRLRNVPEPIEIYQVVEPGVEKGYFSLWEELKRRNVFRVGAAYAVVGWLLIQAASIILPTFEAPRWAMQGLVLLIVLGFPVALVLAWIYELTPMGLKRSDEVLRQASIRQITGRRFNVATIALLVLAVVVLIFDNYLPANVDDSGISKTDSIAVLAFENLSADPDDGYFADGLADELLGALSRIQELRVASRTASFYFKDKDIDAPTIASTLGVTYVLSGRVRRYGDRIRVTAALDNAESNDLLWSESYDRELNDILDIQSEIARSVATAIVPVLSARSERVFLTRPTEVAEAYDYYLRGRDYLRRPGEETTLASAVQLFERAIDLDPRFAHAYAGLCDAYLQTYYLAERSESFANAQNACHQALGLDDGLWEVHLALGTLYRYSGRFDDATLELQSAMAQQPSDVSAYIELAKVYAAQDMVVEAEATFRRAEEVESGYWGVYNEFGNFLWHIYRYRDAIPYYEKVIQLAPDSGIGNDNLGVAYQALGEWDLAERAFDSSPLPSRWTFGNRGLNFYYLREFDKAVEDLHRAIDIAPEVHSSWGRLGDAYRFIPGQEENSRAAYEKAIELAESELSINPSDWETLARLTTYYVQTGRKDEASAGLERLFELTSDPGAYYFAALTSLYLGDRERVYEHLKVVLDSGWSRPTVAIDPDFAVLQDEERFARLIAEPGG